MYRLFHPGFDLDVDSDDSRVSNPSFPLIRDSAFIDLINLCFSRATEFSMTRGRWAASTDRSLENDLQPFLQKTIRTCNWFCYEVRPNSPLEVSVFEANETTRAIVLKYFGELFLSQYVNGKWKSSKQTLEDLCFFSNDRLFMGTVTHEVLCVIYPPDTEFEATIRQNSYWIPDKNFDLQQINLSRLPEIRAQHNPRQSRSRDQER